MLVVRNAQIRALDAIARSQFEERLARRIQRHFAIPCGILGAAGLSACVRSGVDTARRRGFTSEGEVFLFISLMFMFGSGFDSDPQCGWAERPLAPSNEDSSTRARNLYDAAMEHLDRVIGPTNGEQVKVLVRARRFDWNAAGDSGDSDGRARLIDILRRLHPRKCTELGTGALDRLLDEGRGCATRYGLPSFRGQMICSVLMFLLGARFDGDPLYPWAGQALRANNDSHERARLDGLQQAALAYLDRALAGSPHGVEVT